jgi:hypothetical protein
LELGPRMIQFLTFLPAPRRNLRHRVIGRLSFPMKLLRTRFFAHPSLIISLMTGRYLSGQ